MNTTNARPFSLAAWVAAAALLSGCGGGGDGPSTGMPGGGDAARPPPNLPWTGSDESADTLLMTDFFVHNDDVTIRIQTDCNGASCTLGFLGESETTSLSDIFEDPDGEEELAATETHRGVSLARWPDIYAEDDLIGDFEGYAGWLEHNVFAAGHAALGDEETGFVSIPFGMSFGDATGTNPTFRRRGRRMVGGHDWRRSGRGGVAAQRDPGRRRPDHCRLREPEARRGVHQHRGPRHGRPARRHDLERDTPDGRPLRNGPGRKLDPGKLLRPGPRGGRRGLRARQDFRRVRSEAPVVLPCRPSIRNGTEAPSLPHEAGRGRARRLGFTTGAIGGVIGGLSDHFAVQRKCGRPSGSGTHEPVLRRQERGRAAHRPSGRKLDHRRRGRRHAGSVAFCARNTALDE